MNQEYFHNKKTKELIKTEHNQKESKNLTNLLNKNKILRFNYP